MMTTLTTVGYGDFYPVNKYERVIILPILIAGITIFGFIFGNLILLMTEYQSLDDWNSLNELQKWFN